jgi:hypothetical protein
MKRVFCAISFLALLSACASTENRGFAKHDSQSQTNTSGYDEKYMARVEREALQRGVTIKWVSPPRAPKSKKDGR